MIEQAPVRKKKDDTHVLRFLTCGSVDDGKSTLIGRLLFDTRSLFDDQMQSVISDSKKYGTTGELPDLALLVDGLQAEREQGITIDVAYRYFSTNARKFILADTPGHEQYTRNMVTGASNSGAAILLIDARTGVTLQTQRHGFLASLLGVPSIVVAINKMDMVDYDESVFNDIRESLIPYLKKLSFDQIHFIPVSALRGDLVVFDHGNMPWYKGPTLIKLLEGLPHRQPRSQSFALRFPVQFVNRPNAEFRGYAGTIHSGKIKVGDRIKVIPSGKETNIDSIVTFDGKMDEANVGEAITLVVKDALDITRGDIIIHANETYVSADSVDSIVVWMDGEPLFPGKTYFAKWGTSYRPARVEKIIWKYDISDLSEHSSDSLSMNEIGLCRIRFTSPLLADSYANQHETGSFILIDRITNHTAGACMIRSASVRENVVWHTHKIAQGDRAALKGQKPCVIWLTGLSGSGKSTIASALEARLYDMGVHTYLLDGDNLRHGLNRDLGFSEQHRTENIRRAGEVSKLFVDAGLIVIAALISPFRHDRRLVRSLLQADQFFEVYIKAPLDVCMQRDPKGLYAKARRGEIQGFTGIDSPYEVPENPDIVLPTDEWDVDECVTKVLQAIFRTNR